MGIVAAVPIKSTADPLCFVSAHTRHQVYFSVTLQLLRLRVEPKTVKMHRARHLVAFVALHEEHQAGIALANGTSTVLAC